MIQHHAGGIAGVCDEDGPGVLGDEAFDPFPFGVAVALPGIGGQSPDDAACRMDEGGVVGIVGLRNNDLGIGVQNAEAGQKQRLATAGGDENFLPLQINAKPPVIAPDGVNQYRYPRGRM